MGVVAWLRRMLRQLGEEAMTGGVDEAWFRRIERIGDAWRDLFKGSTWEGAAIAALSSRRAAVEAAIRAEGVAG